MPAAISARAPAKLNLFIHVQGRRADGYHLIESAAVFTELADEISLTPADDLQLTVAGPFAEAAGAGEGNLVLKAARLLQSHLPTPKGAHLTLTKNIPVGAGLGGGSSDAAAVLKLLNQFWELHLPMQILHDLAPSLGADVAMCLEAQPVIATGIGEILTLFPSKLPPIHAVLVHPSTPLLTADVYAALRREPLREHAPFAPNEATLSFPQLLHHLQRTRNDLQRAAISVSSTVAETMLALETLTPPSEFVRMTGSGACCYALYSTRDEAERAAAHLGADYPQWWVKATAIL